MRYLLTIATSLLTLTVSAQEQSTYDQDAPFGFCTVSSRTDASSTYDITGGGCYTYPIPDNFTGKVVTLKSNGQDKVFVVNSNGQTEGTIQNAIKQNDIIILDGSDGDFIVSSSIGFERGNKTIIGINKARICTSWYLTDEDKALLDNATDSRTPNVVGVKNMSTNSKDNLGGTVNGSAIKEQAEFITRKTLYAKYGHENYRNAGIFSLNKENVIIRNITFVGPGAVDVGGSDLLSATGAKHCWVDHCEFIDGMDGNFDITNSADFNTVSWCIFRYTSRSYVHQNTNLVGSSDSEATGYLNTTFAFNWWAPGCNQRMPMARVGKIHMLNNYFSSTSASNCINPRKNSEFLIEGNYFASGVNNFYSQSDATAVTWGQQNYHASKSLPSSTGTTVTVPYTYTVAPYSDVPTEVQKFAGATLKYGDITEPTVNSFINWAFSTGTEGQTANLSGKAADGIESATVTLGSELTYGTGADPTKAKTLNAGGNTETLIWQKQVNTSASDNNAITFAIKPKSGYTLQVTNVSFTATRNGTDKGKLDAKWVDGNGSTELCTGVTPKRNSTPSGKADESPYYTTYDFSLETVATTGESKLVINLYDLAFNDSKTGALTPKSYGFCNISIKGVIVDKTTGISTPITMKFQDSGAIYNLAGQKVDASYRGVVIKNGKKYVQ